MAHEKFFEFLFFFMEHLLKFLLIYQSPKAPRF